MPGTAGMSLEPLKGSLSPAWSLGFDPFLAFVPLECAPIPIPIPPEHIPWESQNLPARNLSSRERVGKDPLGAREDPLGISAG